MTLLPIATHEEGIMIPTLWILWSRKQSPDGWGICMRPQSRESLVPPERDLAGPGWKYLPEGQQNKLEAQAGFTSFAFCFSPLTSSLCIQITPFADQAIVSPYNPTKRTWNLSWIWFPSAHIRSWMNRNLIESHACLSSWALQSRGHYSFKIMPHDRCRIDRFTPRKWLLK